jgi:hypothetical protein
MVRMGMDSEAEGQLTGRIAQVQSRYERSIVSILLPEGLQR